MNKYLRASLLLVAVIFVCLCGFVPESHAQNHHAYSKHAQSAPPQKKPGALAPPWLRHLARHGVVTADQEAEWRHTLPTHLQNLPLQMLAKMPWLQMGQTIPAGLPRDLHPPAKFKRPWEKLQNQLKQSKPASKIAASSDASQLMSSCLSGDWVSRYNDPGNSNEYAVDLAVDGSGNVFVTGYTAGSSGADYLTIKYNAAGVQQWKARYDGPANGSDYAVALAVDGSGNVFVTGSSTNSDFTNDYATIKYDASGVLQWEARYDGPSNFYDGAVALAVDGNSNVYVTGYSYNSDFTTDYATIKYNASGAQQWEARFDGPANSYDGAVALAVDGSSNVYVTGSSQNSDNTTDYATVKYDAAGVQQWATRYNGSEDSNDNAAALAVDGSSNVYVTGISSTADLTANDYVTIQYDAAGVQQWEAHYDGPAHAHGEVRALVVDGSGNAYVTGDIYTGDSFDYATVKYNGAGVEQWAALYDGPAQDTDAAYDLAVDASGNVYVTGYSNNSDGTDDYATVKYDAAGVQQWLTRYNGPADSYDDVTALALDGSGNAYVTGESYNGFNYDCATVKYNGTTGAELWSVRHNETNQPPDQPSENPKAMTVDGDGNVYVTGISYLTGAETDYLTVKYNASGMLEWAKRYNGPANLSDEVYAIAVDGSGNVYVTGASYGFDGVPDYATIKYDATGVQQWEARYNGSDNLNDEAYALAVDGSGNVYVTGGSESSSSGWDYVTVKYNAAGVQQWEARYDGPGNDYDLTTALALDGSGNIYVTGYSYNSGGNSDYVTIKYNAAGVQQWEARYDGPENLDDFALVVAVDGSGNVFVTGGSYNSGGYSDYATIKYNSAGAQQWEARYNGPGDEYDYAVALAVDGSSNVYVTGFSINSSNNSDYATIKYNAAGVPQWEARYDGPGNDYDSPTALALDGSGSVYVTGTSNSGFNNDYATIKYDAAGVQQCEARYNGLGNSEDSPVALVVDGSGNVYVTGNSFDLSDDFATIKYSSENSCVAAEIGALIVPVNPTVINIAINVSADFTAECDNDDHSATWDWGDNTSSAGTVDQSGNSVTGSHPYTAAGVYAVTLTVTNGAGNSGEGTATAFVVIYDPNAGFVTGGGWIMSPAGAYVADPSLTGKANFGFVSKYQKGKTIPDGNTEFNFKASSLNFHSTIYEWLVIAGPNAKYKGSGTINNSGNYGFMLTARDGQINGGGGVDKFRIKIWDKNDNDAVVYDNQMNDADDAEATDAIEGGSITIHSSASKEAAEVSELAPVSFMLEQNYPNPFNPETEITFALPNPGYVTLRIYSVTGQLVATLVDGEMAVGRHRILWNGLDQNKHEIAAGVYLYRLAAIGPNGETMFTQTKRMTVLK